MPSTSRDAWLDLALGIDASCDDGPELPRGCGLIALFGRRAARDRRRDTGAHLGRVRRRGVGRRRALALVYLLTGAAVVGIEIQPHLVRSAREIGTRLVAARIANIEGDAATLTGYIMVGSVFFLYCPFSGER